MFKRKVQRLLIGTVIVFIFSIILGCAIYILGNILGAADNKSRSVAVFSAIFSIVTIVLTSGIKVWFKSTEVDVKLKKQVSENDNIWKPITLKIEEIDSYIEIYNNGGESISWTKIYVEYDKKRGKKSNERVYSIDNFTYSSQEKIYFALEDINHLKNIIIVTQYMGISIENYNTFYGGFSEGETYKIFKKKDWQPSADKKNKKEYNSWFSKTIKKIKHFEKVECERVILPEKIRVGGNTS